MPEQAGGGGAVAPGCAGGRTNLAYAGDEGGAFGKVWVGWEDRWVWRRGLVGWHDGFGVVFRGGLVVGGLIVGNCMVYGDSKIVFGLYLNYRCLKNELERYWNDKNDEL